MKIIKEIIPYIIIIILVVLIRTFIATPVVVSGSSMYPTLENNESLILKKYDNGYERFDIVVLKYNDEKLIKRIIGLPGELVEYKDGKLYIDNNEVDDPFASITSDFNISEIGSTIVPDNCYLVLGDNRNNSIDSRKIGFVNKKNIKGTTSLRILPINKFGKITVD